MTAAEQMKRLTVVMLVDPGNLARGGRSLIHGQADVHLVRALRRLARRAVFVPYEGVPALAESIERERPDVIFNLTEWIEGDRTKDGHICALLDLYGVPYTGSGPKGLILCRDKIVSKLIAEDAGFAVPRYVVVSPRTRSPLPFPLVVKPRFGDASDGISQNSLVRSNESLLRRAAMLRRGGVESVIAEEYAAGRELLVTILGKRIMSIRELVIGRDGPNSPAIFSAELKHDKKYRRRWAVRMEPASLTRAQRQHLTMLSRRAAAALELRDYGRFDLKLTPSGEFVFLEANPNPAVVPPRKSFSGSWGGMSFDNVVTEITLRAWRRRER
jgi:D-alanine-D-alanine ligase